MKLIGNELQKFLSQEIDFKSILFYGNDEDLMKYRCEAILKNYTKKFDCINFDFKSMKIANLFDEIASIDFFSELKIIKITNCNDKIFASISEKISNLDDNVKIIFISSEIAKSPNMKKFHEDLKSQSYSIPCYGMEIFDVKKMILNFFKKYNIALEYDDLLNEIVDLMNNNIYDINNELEKIRLLKGENSILYYNEIKNIISFDQSIVYELIDTFFEKNKEKFSKTIHASMSNDIDMILIFRSLYKYAMKLISAMINILNGSDRAIEAKKSGIFMRKYDIFYKHISIWKIEELENFVINIFNLDLNFRKKSFNSEVLYKLLNFN